MLTLFVVERLYGGAGSVMRALWLSSVNLYRLFDQMTGDKILGDRRSIDANLGVFFSYTCFSLDHLLLHNPEGITLTFKGISASTNESLVFTCFMCKDPYSRNSDDFLLGWGQNFLNW